MIKANELRIGNWVSLERNGIKQNFKVAAIESSNNGNAICILENDSLYFKQSSENDGDLQLIQLTTEILEKAGFDLYDSEPDIDSDGIFVAYRKWVKKYIYYGISGIKDVWQFGVTRQLKEPTRQIEIDSDSFVISEIKYLHQLQNLYFALTGEDLSIQV